MLKVLQMDHIELKEGNMAIEKKIEKEQREQIKRKKGRKKEQIKHENEHEKEQIKWEQEHEKE